MRASSRATPRALTTGGTEVHGGILDLRNVVWFPPYTSVYPVVKVLSVRATLAAARQLVTSRKPSAELVAALSF